MTRHRLFSLSPEGGCYHLIPAECLADAVARARAQHAEAVGDVNPDCIHVTTPNLHPVWTPDSVAYEQDKVRVQ